MDSNFLRTVKPYLITVDQTEKYYLANMRSNQDDPINKSYSALHNAFVPRYWQAQTLKCEVLIHKSR